MILQALTEYYEALSAKGEISALGWGPSKVSLALYVAPDGSLERMVNICTEQLRGKKTVLAPQELIVPAPVKRASGTKANFLCDHAGYLLGLDSKGKPERTAECYEKCKELHLQLLEDVDDPAAEALKNFFLSWEPKLAQKHPQLQEHLEEILSGANLVFRCADGYVHENPVIRQVWNCHYNQETEGDATICLVSGERGTAEPIHPSIKNVAGAQSSGAALVSFNAPAFCSYGKKQNMNAPTGKYATFAYTSALNKLLSDKERVQRIGDTSVVCWAKNGNTAYQDLFSFSFFGKKCSYTETELIKMTGDLCRGVPVQFEESLLSSDMDFYVLGISPNAARLSVRFFLHNSFGNFLKNAQAHYDRLEIIRPSFDADKSVSLWWLLSETVNQHSQDKTASPGLSGEVLRAILNNTHYPATLLNGVMLRIHADRTLNFRRAAILKAYYLKNIHPDVPKEVLTVSLNPESNNPAYVLGRLFSLLEAIQNAANPGINATIKDKYFNSAAATPSHVFAILMPLAQKHLKKLSPSKRIYFEQQLTELLGKLEEFPARLTLPMQSAFHLGYYHQTQKRYEKKEEQ